MDTKYIILDVKPDQRLFSSVLVPLATLLLVGRWSKTTMNLGESMCGKVWACVHINLRLISARYVAGEWQQLIQCWMFIHQFFNSLFLSGRGVAGAYLQWTLWKVGDTHDRSHIYHRDTNGLQWQLVNFSPGGALTYIHTYIQTLSKKKIYIMEVV